MLELPPTTDVSGWHMRLCDFEFLSDLQRVQKWEPLHDIPERLWRYERRRQWMGKRGWCGGARPSLWRVDTADVPQGVGWLVGTGANWAAFLADGTPCPYLAGPWERLRKVRANMPWSETQLDVHVMHRTRWEAMFAMFCALIDAYGPRPQ